jgi:hypothetical protein
MRILFLLIFLAPPLARSQDTLSVYFATGSTKVRPYYSAKIGELRQRYDLSGADSVRITGYADTAGRADANFRLSMKRAGHVYKNMKDILPAELPFSIDAEGEQSRVPDSLNRRVDIVIYSRFARNAAANGGYDPNGDDIVTAEIGCFVSDRSMIGLINTKIVKSGRKENVVLETEEFGYFRENPLYCVREVDIKGKAVLQRVKWKEKTTGQLWWKKKRLTASVAKYGFDRFFLVELQKAPCDGCSERVLNRDTVLRRYPVLFDDYFLMSNMQMKVRLFGNGRVKLRVPKEYVDPAGEYYFSYRQSYLSSSRIEWESSDRKKKRLYYFAEAELDDRIYLPGITRLGMTTRCERNTNYIPSAFRSGRMTCGGVRERVRWPGLSANISMEAGAFRHNDSTTAYVAAGCSHITDRTFTSLHAGVNSNLGLYGSARFQFDYFSFPFKALSPRGWSSPSSVGPVDVYGRLFAGAETKLSYNKSYRSFSEVNLHAGLLCINAREKAAVPRIFVYGGIARDLSNTISRDPYMFVQTGIVFRIASVIFR